MRFIFPHFLKKATHICHIWAVSTANLRNAPNTRNHENMIMENAIQND